jgi:DNA helicase-4
VGSAFPAEKEDDPLLNLVLPQPEIHAFAEERRLFYVALTRAKEKVYLIGERIHFP